MDPDAALMNKVECTQEGADLAAEEGHLEVLKYLFYEKNMSVTIAIRIWIWVSDICRRGDNYVRSRHTKNKLE